MYFTELKKEASMAYQIQVCTKKADPEFYPDGLARSIHFALSKGEGTRTELNRGTIP